MRFIKASRIFDGTQYLPQGCVMAVEKDGTIKELLEEDQVDPLNVKSYEGLLTPGFINTHCHLELSHLKGRIPEHTGIVDFGLQIIEQRHDASAEIQQAAMQEADAAMQAAGIAAVGDISNTNSSVNIKSRSALYYHTFVELIALNPKRAESVMEQGKTLANEYRAMGLTASLAAHAPYTASLQLIRGIAEDCAQQQQPTSIHNQESKAENDFFEFKTGDYLRLYDTLKVPIDFFQASSRSSLQTISGAFLPNVPTLLVHNTFSSSEDIKTAEQVLKKTYWCLCPNANLYIENTLPDLNLLMQHHCHVTIGTDSLASNYGLSVIDEINVLLKHFPHIPVDYVLKAATANGAQFLGIGHLFGTLEKNKKPGINLLTEKKGQWSVQRLF